MKNKRGITLIALVITIIVLLILAGVSITSIVKEDGIIAKAQNAKQETKIGQLEEEKQLNDCIDIIEDSSHYTYIEYNMTGNVFRANLAGDIYHLSKEEYIKKAVEVRELDQLKEEHLQLITLSSPETYKANITWEEYLAQEAITEEKFIEKSGRANLKEALADNYIEYNLYAATGKIEGKHDINYLRDILAKFLGFSNFTTFVEKNYSGIEKYNEGVNKARSEEALLKQFFGYLEANTFTIIPENPSSQGNSNYICLPNDSGATLSKEGNYKIITIYMGKVITKSDNIKFL